MSAHVHNDVVTCLERQARVAASSMDSELGKVRWRQLGKNAVKT